jgi:restriction endonuclease Mrr
MGILVPIELDAQEQRDVGRKARAAVLEVIKTLGGEGTRREILEQALQAADFTKRELAAAAPVNGREKHETFVHYRLSWTLTNLKHDGVLENPRRGVWRVAGAASEPARQPVDWISPERLAELRAMPHQQYLRTPEWRKTRASALQRASHRCSLDRTHTDRLEVHHNSYDRVGDELPSDLIVLCHACHQLHHQANGRPRRPRPDPRTGELPRPGSPPPPHALSSARPRRTEQTSGKPSLLRRILARV